jgi:hypothetical protein
MCSGRGASLYVHVFVFRALAGAESLTRTFLDSTRLGTAVGVPSGAPGEPREASSQAYGRHEVSYRYAFRDHNVLSYIELDGPRGRVSLSQVADVARLIDLHIRAALG